MSAILVIGSLNMDMTFYVNQFPQVGQTINSQGFFMAPGGKGSNQALAAARLGAQVYMAGCVGADVYADALIDDLEESKVDTTLVQRMAGTNTGLACITVCEGSNMITVDAGANARMTPDRIDQIKEIFEKVDIVILQFEIPMPTVERAAELARQSGCTVIVNPAPYMPMSQKLLQHIDYLIPNETEAQALLGWQEVTPRNAFEALKAMLDMGIPHPMITLGDQGVAYLDGDEYRVQKCIHVKAVDTTAAGDTFIGALACGMLSGKTMPQAVEFAQRASAICVTRKGAHSSIPTLSEVLAAYAE